MYLAKVRPLVATFVLACAVLPAAATDWQGRKLADPPVNFIFGYGSLINTASRNATAAAPIHAIPVRVAATFGYVRAWNDRSASGFTALGLRKSRPGEAGRTINGILYPVEGTDMARFDAREKGYVRLEVPLGEIEAVSWQRLPESGRVWVYVPVHAAGGIPGEGLPEPDAMFPLLQSYIDLVVEGALEYGSDYAREFVDTTEGWDPYWLNDRELARRPWVHDPRTDAVDAILTSTPASAAQFSARMFSEMYAERLRAGAGK